MKFLFMLLVVPLLATPAFAQTNSQTLPTEQGTLDVKLSYDEIIPGQQTRLNIDFINPQTEKVQEHIDYTVTVSKSEQNVFGPIPLTHTSEGSVRIPVDFADEGFYDVYIEVEGILFQPIPAEAVSFGVAVGQEVQTPPPAPPATDGGGCLIATATYGSEFAPQVQQLREIRDRTVLGTESGTAFMSGFNQIYYSFSPAVADLEREHPLFRDAVRVALVPMLASLSVLDHVEIESEGQMLGYGISLILLNIGMYVGAPLVAILKIYQMQKKRFRVTA